MDRAEAAGVGVSLTGHLAVLATLALGFATVTRPPLISQPIEVSFVDDIGLESAVPQPSTEAPAQSVAPEIGAPEEAMPEPEPEPVPTPPEPKAKAEPAKVEKPAAPAPKPVEKAVKPKATPKEAAAPAKAAPAKAERQTDTKAAGKAERTRGSRLGSNFLKGLGLEANESRAQTPSGAVMSAAAMTSIGAAILRQVQPCADRQVNPGPGANRIVTEVNLKLNRDGSLASRPTIGRQSGTDDENERYKERVADLAVATFVGCSPLRDLPEELYDVPNGWRSFTLRYRLPT